jgi:hypothetical protein
LSRLTPRVVNEKWPLKNRMLSRKCRESESVLDHSLTSSGIGSASASLIFPFRQQKPSVSRSNFLAWQCSQSGSGCSMCVLFGRLEYTKSKGSIDSAPNEFVDVDVSRSMSSASNPTSMGCHTGMEFILTRNGEGRWKG